MLSAVNLSGLCHWPFPAGAASLRSRRLVLWLSGQESPPLLLFVVFLEPALCDHPGLWHPALAALRCASGRGSFGLLRPDWLVSGTCSHLTSLWTLSSPCMVYFLVILLVILSFVNHYSYSAAKSTQAESASSCPVASPQDWQETSGFAVLGSARACSTEAPFEGLGVSCKDQSSDGEANATRMVMRQLQKDEIPSSVVLRPLWREMGRLCHSHFHSKVKLPEPLHLRTGGDQLHALEWTRLAEEPQTEPTSRQRSQQAEAQSVAVQRWEERQARSQQRQGQGRSNPCATTASAHHGAECLTPTLDLNANSSGLRTTAWRIGSRTETQRSLRPAQQTGSRLAQYRSPSLCPERRHKGCEHNCQAATPRRERPHQGGESHGCCDQLPDKPACKLAFFHHSLTEHMEGVYLPVSTTGTEVSGRDSSCERSTCKGEGKGPGRIWQQRHQDRDRRDGDCLRRGGQQTTGRQGIHRTDSWRAPEHDDEPPRTVSNGRTGTHRSSEECKETSQRRDRREGDARRTSRRSTSRSLGAFLQAWSIVACGYIDRGAETLCTCPMTLKWNHSVVQQPDFLTSWMASERALGLHLELHPFDFNVPVCLEPALGLPAPKYRSHNRFRVRFADNFELFTGLESTTAWSRHLLPLDVHGQSMSRDKSFVELELCKDPLHRVEPLCPYDLHEHSAPHGQWLKAYGVPASPEAFCPLNPILPTCAGQAKWHTDIPPIDSIDEVPAVEAEVNDDPNPEGRPRRLRDGPDQRQPGWMQALWNILQESGHIEMLEEGAVAYLNSHYVSHQRHRRNDSPRPVRIDMDYETWEEGFRFVWEDLADPDAVMEVYVVAPSPPLTIFQGTVGTVILVQHPLPDHLACVITCILGAPPEARITETAHSFETLMEYDNIIRASDMAEVCRMGETYHLCDLKIGRLTLPPGQVVRIQNGLGLQLHLLNSDDDIPIEIVDEDQSMMQTFTSSSSSSPSPSTEAPSRYASRVFQFDGSFCDGILSWETSERFWEALGLIVRLPRSHIRAVHPVRDPPADLRVDFQKVFILHSYRDQCPADQMRVILLDVLYADNDVPERSVRWVPFKVTRESLLKLLRLEGLCWWVTDECTIWQNGYIVPVNQLDPLDVFNGDYMERPCDSILGNDPIFQNRWLFSNQWKFLDRSSLHLAKLIFGNLWHGLQSLHKSITWKFLQLGSFQNSEVSLTWKFPELGSFSNLEVSLWYMNYNIYIYICLC